MTDQQKELAQKQADNKERALTLHDRINSPDIQARFKEVLGKKAAGFVSSVISAVKTNSMLKTCAPDSVISAAMIAATLDLPINQSLGYAYIVPYKDKGVPKAQFQMGWKGYTQLSLRSGQFARMNASPIYEGELIYWDRVAGEFSYDLDRKTSDKIVGYVSYFRLINGYEHYLYMKIEEIRAHAERYSQSYRKGYGPWKDNFESMCLKTVHKLNLSKWAPMTQDMELALRLDQATIKETSVLNGDEMLPEFPDAAQEVEAEAEIQDEKNEPEKLSTDDMKPGDPSKHQGHEPAKQENLV